MKKIVLLLLFSNMLFANNSVELEVLRLKIKDIQPKVVDLKKEQAQIKKLENRISKNNRNGLTKVNDNYYDLLDKYYSLVISYGNTDHEHRKYQYSNSFIMKQYKYLVNHARRHIDGSIKLDKNYNVIVNGEKLQSLEVTSSNTINHLDQNAQKRIVKGLLNNLVIEYVQTKKYNTREDPVRNSFSELSYLDDHSYDGDLNWIVTKYYSLISGHEQLKNLLKGAKGFNTKLKENYQNLVDYVDSELDEDIKMDYHGFLVINNERVLLP